MLDLKITNGIVVNHDSASPRDIGIEGGTVVEVGTSGSLGAARREIDATDLHVLPGAIDVHFHCRAPSHPERGDFASESGAAAAGGVTTIFEMPISDPACSTPEVFRQRRAIGERDSYVNFALYSGAVLGGRDQACEMAEAGAIAFKLFTLAPAYGRESEFQGLWASTEGGIYEALQAVAATGLPCVVHAENEPLVKYFGAQPAVQGVPLRPPVVEAAEIALVATIAKEVTASVHIAHISSRSALDAVRGASTLGGSITAETCPQYLLLNSPATQQYGGLAKIAPPLREPEDSEALWGGLRDGTLSIVASDHSPFLAREKVGVEFARAPQGLPTVEILVPTMLDAAARGLLPLELAVSLVTYLPARRFGLYPQKGRLAPGSDADLTLVSLRDIFRPGRDALLTRGADCAVVFGDLSLSAKVRTTIVGGRTIYENGQLLGPPAGSFVPGPVTTARTPA